MPDTNRRQIFAACQDFFEAKTSQPFIPGKTYIPPSGKILDSDDLINLVDASLDMWLTAGRFAKKFEANLSQKTGVKYSRLTVSGSAANLLAFSALTSPKLNDRKIKPGSEILTVAAAFPTTVAPIIQNKCVPIFVDVDIGTYNVNIEQLQAAVTPKTRAIMMAHTMGNPFNLTAVQKIAKEHNLFLIEDCCDALGASFEGKGVGTWGELATLSFYPAHHITMGEGGAILTNKKLFSRLVESFRDWGRDCWCAPGKDNTCKKRFGWKLGGLPEGYDHKYIHSHIGYNLKTTDMNAAIGLSQLSKADDFIQKRRENYAFFMDGFTREGLDEHFILPRPTPGSDPSWFGFLLTIRDESPLERKNVINYLEKKMIGTRLMFAGNITKQPAFQDIEYKTPFPLPVSDKIMRDSFWVGLWPGIGEKERHYMLEVFSLMKKELVK